MYNSFDVTFNDPYTLSILKNFNILTNLVHKQQTPVVCKFGFKETVSAPITVFPSAVFRLFLNSSFFS